MLDAPRTASEGWSYDHSSLRTGTRPELVWYEYPLAAVFRASVTGLHQSERATCVFVCGAPCKCSNRPRTVAEALALAAETIESAADERDREAARSAAASRPAAQAGPQPLVEAWREIARRLRTRLEDPALAAIPI